MLLRSLVHPKSEHGVIQKLESMESELYDPIRLEELNCVPTVKRHKYLCVSQAGPMLQRLTQGLSYQCVLIRHLKKVNSLVVKVKEQCTSDINNCLVRKLGSEDVQLLCTNIEHLYVSNMTGQQKLYHDSNVMVDENAAFVIANTENALCHQHNIKLKPKMSTSQVDPWVGSRFL